MTTMTSFEPSTYKRTTRDQWERAAEAWHRWGPMLRTWLGPATERMLDAAKVAAGCRVLDIAAGAGDQTLQVAARVGPGGSVLATDISPTILAFAAAEAKRAGHANVATRPSALMPRERGRLSEESLMPGLAARVGEPAAWETRVVVPRTRSWRKTSRDLFSSSCPGERSGAPLRKAT